MPILKKIMSDDVRARMAQKNIILLFLNKGIAALISLQLIPAAIGYVDATQYGIWITLSSIVAWMIYFDMGLTHGFRNGFATAKANCDISLAKEYIATSYAILAMVFFIVMIIGLISNHFISWSSILNVDKNLDSTLRNVFVITVVFLSLQMVLNLFTTLLIADQKPAFAGFITTIGQLCALLAIYILTFFTKGNLIYLAFALMGIPTILLGITTILLFQTKYKIYAPSIKKINWSLSKRILGLGGKFFIIQLSMLFIFQFSNLIISRVMGAEAVTNYNIAYRYFSIIYIIMGIIFLPFWSSFTDAYTKGELGWMKSMYNKLSKVWILTIPIFIGMLTISPYVYKYWLANGIQINFSLSLAMGLNMIILSRANLYMYCINGTGKVFLQMIIYIFFSLISIPMMFILSKQWGYLGIIFVSSLVYLTQSIIGHIQLKKILNGNEHGVWKK